MVHEAYVKRGSPAGHQIVFRAHSGAAQSSPEKAAFAVARVFRREPASSLVGGICVHSDVIIVFVTRLLPCGWLTTERGPFACPRCRRSSLPREPFRSPSARRLLPVISRRTGWTAAPSSKGRMVNDQLTPAALIADSSGNKGRWYRAQGWSGGCAPKKDCDTRRR